MNVLISFKIVRVSDLCFSFQVGRDIDYDCEYRTYRVIFNCILRIIKDGL